jgi:HEAT repeat protein
MHEDSFEKYNIHLNELSHAETFVKLEILRRLTQDHVENASKYIILLLDDPVLDVQIEAIEALGVLQDKKMVKRLVHLLNGTNELISSLAAETMVSIIMSNTSSLKARLSCLSHPNYKIRQYAIRFFKFQKNMGDKSLIAERLINLLDDASPEVQNAVKTQLSKWEDIAQFLLEKLDEQNVQRTKLCIYILGELQVKEGNEAIIKYLKSDNIEFRKEAVLAVAKMNSEQVPQYLLRLKEDRDIEVKKVLILALFKYIATNSEVRNFILDLTRDENLDIQRKALFALEQTNIRHE